MKSPKGKARALSWGSRVSLPEGSMRGRSPVARRRVPGCLDRGSHRSWDQKVLLCVATALRECAPLPHLGSLKHDASRELRCACSGAEIGSGKLG